MGCQKRLLMSYDKFLWRDRSEGVVGVLREKRKEGGVVWYWWRVNQHLMRRPPRLRSNTPTTSHFTFFNGSCSQVSYFTIAIVGFCGIEIRIQDNFENDHTGFRGKKLDLKFLENPRIEIRCVKYRIHPSFYRTLGVLLLNSGFRLNADGCFFFGDWL